MKTIIIIVIIAFTSLTSKSQTILLEEEVKDYNDLGNKGPNLSHFLHFYLSAGSMLSYGEDDTAVIDYPGSYNLALGLRYKKKIAEPLSIGLDLQYSLNSYSVSQNEKKYLPDTNVYDNEELNFHQLNLGAYIRINYTKRGNYLGKYIDLGVSGNYTFLHKHKTKEIVNDIKTKTVEKGFSYFEPLSYRAYARIGFNKFSFMGYYRLTDLFKENYNYSELPRIGIGIELALF